MCQTTRHHVAENGYLCNHFHENLNSHQVCVLLVGVTTEPSFQSCLRGKKFQNQINALTVKDISQKAGHIWDFLKKRKITVRGLQTTMKSKER